MVWNEIRTDIVGPTQLLWKLIKAAHDSGDLADLSDSDHLHVFSDYGGDHQSSGYQTYTFLLIDVHRSTKAIDKLREVRQNHLPDGRSISFKGLRDAKQASALPGFIGASRGLHGNVVSFAVDKDLVTLFERFDNSDETDQELDRIVAKLTPNTVERAGRILHLFSLLIAGFSSPYQDITWVTDRDEIAANAGRLRGLTQLTANLSSHYLTHDCGHLRIATLESDDGTGLLKDLVAVADLISGAYSETATADAASRGEHTTADLVLPLNGRVREKTIAIPYLVSRGTPALRSLFLSLNRVDPGNKLLARRHQYHYFIDE